MMSSSHTAINLSQYRGLTTVRNEHKETRPGVTFKPKKKRRRKDLLNGSNGHLQLTEEEKKKNQSGQLWVNMSSLQGGMLVFHGTNSEETPFEKTGLCLGTAAALMSFQPVSPPAEHRELVSKTEKREKRSGGDSLFPSWFP